MMPYYAYKKTLTGRVRPRRTWYGKVLMQVEVISQKYNLGSDILSGHSYLEWRDADINDYLEHEYKNETI
jgi:hypothetical protein